MTLSPDTVTGSRPERDASGLLPIAAYAMLSDCTSAALVGSDGSIDWLCLPRFDSSALFSRLLDPDGRPLVDRARRSDYTVERRYLPGTLVIETTFTTDDRQRPPDRRAGVRRGPARPRPRPRRAARAAALRRGRLRRASSSRWSWRRGPSTGSCIRSLRHDRRRRAHVRRPQPGRRCAPARRCAVERRHDARRASRSRAGDEVGFSMRWAPPEDRASRTPTAPRRRAPRASRTPPRRGAPGRPSTTSTRARTASSCASARAC